jgi:hypothetical protein
MFDNNKKEKRKTNSSFFPSLYLIETMSLNQQGVYHSISRISFKPSFVSCGTNDVLGFLVLFLSNFRWRILLVL